MRTEWVRCVPRRTSPHRPHSQPFFRSDERHIPSLPISSQCSSGGRVRRNNRGTGASCAFDRAATVSTVALTVHRAWEGAPTLTLLWALLPQPLDDIHLSGAPRLSAVLPFLRRPRHFSLSQTVPSSPPTTTPPPPVTHPGSTSDPIPELQHATWSHASLLRQLHFCPSLPCKHLVA